MRSIRRIFEAILRVWDLVSGAALVRFLAKLWHLELESKWGRRNQWIVGTGIIAALGLVLLCSLSWQIGPGASASWRVEWYTLVLAVIIILFAIGGSLTLLYLADRDGITLL